MQTDAWCSVSLFLWSWKKSGGVLWGGKTNLGSQLGRWGGEKEKGKNRWCWGFLGEKDVKMRPKGGRDDLQPLQICRGGWGGNSKKGLQRHFIVILYFWTDSSSTSFSEAEKPLQTCRAKVESLCGGNIKQGTSCSSSLWRTETETEVSE